MRGHMQIKPGVTFVFFLFTFSMYASVLRAEDAVIEKRLCWSRLLATYVNNEGLVKYGDWKKNEEDLNRLDEYLDFVSGLNFNEAKKDSDALSALLNAYNALIIKQILVNYPIPSVQTIPKFFTIKHKLISGKQISLNELEEWIRSFGDYRVHSALVSGAKSAPPLLAVPYEADTLGAQLDAQMSRWLGRADLNYLDRSENVFFVSKLFNWYKRDFGASDEELYTILIRFNPTWQEKENLKGVEIRRIEFKDFDWSLNETTTDSKSQG